MPEERVHTVSGITAEIRVALESGFPGVWVEGEISNYRFPGSGHHYFTLKDSGAQLSCVLFRGSARSLTFSPANGQQVQVYGDISVYEARGQYQLIAQMVQPKGHGDLQAQFEALKRKLSTEGLFDPERKRSLPPFPTRIGIVTSPTGAAVQDMLNVLRRRAPWIQVIIYPARVQGEGAAGEIAEGVTVLTDGRDFAPVDLVIVARGGGSIEDLWAFNEEEVARSIANCPVPVMSGVGHEIDFTIADFAADRREPTPSAAAENAVPDGRAVLRQITHLDQRLDGIAKHRIAEARSRALSLERELKAREPVRMLRGWAQTVDFLGEKLTNLAGSHVERTRHRFLSVAREFAAIRTERTLSENRDALCRLKRERERVLVRRIEIRRERLARQRDLLETLSPQSVLARGFSVTLDEEGNALRSVDQLREGATVTTRLSTGSFRSRVEDTGET